MVHSYPYIIHLGPRDFVEYARVFTYGSDRPGPPSKWDGTSVFVATYGDHDESSAAICLTPSGMVFVSWSFDPPSGQDDPSYYVGALLGDLPVSFEELAAMAGDDVIFLLREHCLSAGEQLRYLPMSS